MFLVLLFVVQFSNAQSYSYNLHLNNPVTQDVKEKIRAVENEFDLFCTEKTKPGFSFSHFSFCSGEYGMSKPCVKKTVYNCKNRGGKLEKKIKTWVSFDSNGVATKLMDFKVKAKR